MKLLRTTAAVPTLVACVAVAVALVLAGCGGGDKDKNASTTPAPTGAELTKPQYIAAADKIFNVSLPGRSVVQGKPMAAVALGYAPDATTLWVVRKGGQVTAVPAF